jgi:hypothetical protein
MVIKIRRMALLAAALVIGAHTPALAQEGGSVTQVLPIFSQLLSFALPQGFKPVFERADGNSYMRKLVPGGETEGQWTQMISVTGAKGLAGTLSVTPELFLTQIAAGFKRACPDTFSVRRMGTPKIGSQAMVALVGCGTVITSVTPRSQAALIIAIKGSADYYTIEWAERGLASAKALDLGDPKWAGRLASLSPKVCPLLSGEAPPYPNCLDQK